MYLHKYSSSPFPCNSILIFKNNELSECMYTYIHTHIYIYIKSFFDYVTISKNAALKKWKFTKKNRQVQIEIHVVHTIMKGLRILLWDIEFICSNFTRLFYPSQQIHNESDTCRYCFLTMFTCIFVT